MESFIRTCWCTLLFTISVGVLMAHTIPHQVTEFNRLNWIETAKTALSTQITFDFAQPVYFEKKLKKDKLQVKIVFPGMRLSQFDAKQVIAKLSKLKEDGIIKTVSLYEKNKNIRKVTLLIEFAKNREIKKSNNHVEIKTNHLLIKWCKLEEPNRLIFDIFTKESLDALKQQEKIILYAHNSAIKSDIDFFYPQAKKTTINKQPRIVIDAGHGGSDDGAKRFGMKEKDLALDIAKNVRNKLIQDGYQALLTRDTDSDLDIADRTQLAQQLHANLFVSIHVNAAPAGENTKFNGLETFYLSTKEHVAPTANGGLLFVNLDKDSNYQQAIDNFLKDNANISRTLAKTIQKNVLLTLNKQNISIVDRGVKTAAHLRVLLRSNIPAALVEVGFITNKEEAQKLADPCHRDFLAQGICNGIENYIVQ